VWNGAGMQNTWQVTKYMKILVENRDERRLHGRYTYRRGWEDNIKIDVKKIE
jgi:hypothetical protein